LLSNFGGPSGPEQIEPFLFELFYDVVDVPLGRRWLARRLARKRAPLVTPEYARMGGGSPIGPTTERQAQALRAALERRLPAEARPEVRVGMRYTAPFIGEVAREMVEGGVDHLIALPLFPHFSLATTGSVHDALARAVAPGAGALRVSYVPAFHTAPGWADALADRIREAAAGAPEPPFLLFSAHGIPRTLITQRRDPYPDHVADSVRRVIETLAWQGPYGLAWQSKVGRRAWIEPATDRRILELVQAERVRDLLVVPVSFVGDHIETLVELDHTYRGLAERAGVRWFRVTRGLDEHPRFIEALADCVVGALAGAYDGLCYRCLLPRDAAHRRRPRCLDCGARRPAYTRAE
jgi:ferrochelatase